MLPRARPLNRTCGSMMLNLVCAGRTYVSSASAVSQQLGETNLPDVLLVVAVFSESLVAFGLIVIGVGAQQHHTEMVVLGVFDLQFSFAK